MIEDYDGSCIILWPAANHGGPLFCRDMVIVDNSTGLEMLGVTGISLHLGGREWIPNAAITAQITALADEDGSILPTDRPLPVVWENPEADEEHRRAKLGEYLYLVTEMRLIE